MEISLRECLVLGSVTLGLCSAATESPAQVVLSEIMFDAVGSDSHDEFIEIVNLSQSEAIDLTGWRISDEGGYDEIVPATAADPPFLNPGQFAIILNPSYFDDSNTYDSLIADDSLILTIDNSTFGSGGLANSRAEPVSLINAIGETVSEYTYSVGNRAGFSDEKIDLSGPNTVENWADSRTIFGTPGAQNSVSPSNFDLAILSGDLTFWPDRAFAGGAVTIRAVVRNLGFQAAASFQLVLFQDSNKDSTFSPGEELADPLEFNEALAPGDSTAFAFSYDNVASGSQIIGAQVNFELDEKRRNNLVLEELLVGFSERSIVVNEIMFSPLTDQAEWIEIFNRSPDAINLRDWAISDASFAIRAVITANVEIAPSEYFVLAEDSSLFSHFDPPHGSVLVLKNWPALNNDRDSVTLSDIADVRIDQVNYAEEWGGSRGVSLEKINPDLASNDSLNWSSSVAFEGATPGEQNSIFAQILPSTSTLTIEPNPFSPDGDGRDDFAVITSELPVSTAVINVKIYDVRGRLIRFLANNQPSGSRNTFIWDGRDNADQMARMGIYVVFLQALNAAAGVLKSEKRTVVLAGRL